MPVPSRCTALEAYLVCLSVQVWGACCSQAHSCQVLYFLYDPRVCHSTVLTNDIVSWLECTLLKCVLLECVLLKLTNERIWKLLVVPPIVKITRSLGLYPSSSMASPHMRKASHCHETQVVQGCSYIVRSFACMRPTDSILYMACSLCYYLNVRGSGIPQTADPSTFNCARGDLL